MELLIKSPEEHRRLEVYGEYLRKIPQLLQQLDAVEAMYQRALMEEQMLVTCGAGDHSTELYAQRLERTKEQCILRAADIRQQCRLIFALKAQIEAESDALKVLME